MTQTTVLCILDGWGEGKESPTNAIAQAHTPTWDRLCTTYPKALLGACGTDVGLPATQMGNSEVGHLNIGAGRIVLQDLPRIDDTIDSGNLGTQEPLQKFITKLKKSKGTCHLLGLLSPGGVHSHQDHLVALCQELNSQEIPVMVHALLDGRDTPPESAHDYVADFLTRTQDLPYVSLATLGGRYFAMDRDTRWDRTQQGYDTIVCGTGTRYENPLTYIQTNYAHKTTDEFIPPAMADTYEGMSDGDGLLAANFRADRMRQILAALLKEDFDGFARSTKIQFAATLGMVSYASDLDPFIPALFPPAKVHDTLGDTIATAGLKQLRLAETEKYAHVTYFFNGGREEVLDQEERILVPSPKVATYDLQPEMSAAKVTEHLCQAITSNEYALIIVNYANTDMVGHTGDLKATIKAVDCLDECLAKIVQATESTSANLLITADHGNAEVMQSPNGDQKHTAHTMNPVPFLLCTPEKIDLKETGVLADVAPTILDLMNIKKPAKMTGCSLVE